MAPARNQREVETRLREALRQDRARVQLGRISRFGLLEMSRQRLRPSLGESSLRTCPTCNGRGYVRGPESLALSVLRIVQEEAMKDLTGRIVARLPIEVATFLLNEKREDVFDIEKRTGVQIILVPDPSMTLPNYEVERVREEDHRHDSARDVSYELTAEVDATSTFSTGATAQVDEPAVKAVPPSAPPPSRPAPSAESTGRTGLLVRLRTWLFGERPEPGRAAARSQAPSRQGRHGTRRNSTERGRGDGSESRRRGGASRRTETARTTARVTARAAGAADSGPPRQRWKGRRRAAATAFRPRSRPCREARPRRAGRGAARDAGDEGELGPAAATVRAPASGGTEGTAQARDGAEGSDQAPGGGEGSARAPGGAEGLERAPHGDAGSARARGTEGSVQASAGAEESDRAPETGPQAARTASGSRGERGRCVCKDRVTASTGAGRRRRARMRRSGVETETGAAASAQSGSQADPAGDSGASEPAGRPAPKSLVGAAGRRHGRTRTPSRRPMRLRPGTRASRRRKRPSQARNLPATDVMADGWGLMPPDRWMSDYAFG